MTEQNWSKYLTIASIICMHFSMYDDYFLWITANEMNSWWMRKRQKWHLNCPLPHLNCPLPHPWWQITRFVELLLPQSLGHSSENSFHVRKPERLDVGTTSTPTATFVIIVYKLRGMISIHNHWFLMGNGCSKRLQWGGLRTVQNTIGYYRVIPTDW